MEESLRREVASSLRWAEKVLGWIRPCLTPALSVGGVSQRLLASNPQSSTDAGGGKVSPQRAEESARTGTPVHSKEAVSDELLRRLQGVARLLEEVVMRAARVGEPVLADDPWRDSRIALSEEL